MKRTVLLIVLFVNGFILFYGCKKDKEEVDYDTNTSQDNSLAESTFNDVNNMVFQATENSMLSTYKLSKPGQNFSMNSCATVTIHPDTVNHKDTAIIDFSSVNCQCGGLICTDARFRRGKIIVVFTGAYKTPGTVITITFDNYYVGKTAQRMFKVTGQKTVTNLGNNNAGHLHYSIVVNGQLTSPENQTMSWSSNRDREWISGESTTSNWQDDEYVITGSANGTNFEGNSFNVNITSGIHIKMSCPYITQGIFELTPSGKATRTLDYGDGTCDENAKVTINGKEFPIILR
jgi:hypothetical protein